MCIRQKWYSIKPEEVIPYYVNKTMLNKDEIIMGKSLMKFDIDYARSVISVLKAKPPRLNSKSVAGSGTYSILKECYKKVEVFSIFERVYTEHFTIIDDTITVKTKVLTRKLHDVNL